MNFLMKCCLWLLKITTHFMMGGIYNEKRNWIMHARSGFCKCLHVFFKVGGFFKVCLFCLFHFLAVWAHYMHIHCNNCFLIGNYKQCCGNHNVPSGISCSPATKPWFQALCIHTYDGIISRVHDTHRMLNKYHGVFHWWIQICWLFEIWWITTSKLFINTIILKSKCMLTVHYQ